VLAVAEGSTGHTPIVMAYAVVELGLWQIKGRQRGRGKEDKWK